MSPEDAAQAFQDLYSRLAHPGQPLMVPMRWGTFKLTIEAMDEPPRRLRIAWEAAGLPAEQLQILRHGEQLLRGGSR